MTVPETQKDILSYLDHVTREFDPERIERFTTVDIARAMSISRNLASQYLNDLVRRGAAGEGGNQARVLFPPARYRALPAGTT